MPTFDIVSEIDRQEVDNALNQARKELVTRFDFKGSAATIEQPGKDKIVLSAEDGTRLKALHEIVVGKLARRNVDLRNVDHGEAAISSIGNARQEMTIKQGIEGVKAKEIIAAVKGQAALNKAVQCSLLGTEIRVTGKKRDDLQAAIAFLRGKDFGVSLAFKNFRD